MTRQTVYPRKKPIRWLYGQNRDQVAVGLFWTRVQLYTSNQQAQFNSKIHCQKVVMFELQM